MNSTNALRRVVAELELPTSRVILAVLAGSGALGSAVALLACSAWLIARAAQQPPMMELTLVIVAVRGLGIGRGLFRYLERLISHDLPLRGLVHIRGRCYAALAGAPTRVVLGLRRGDLVDRMGTDIDTLADVLVRGVLPFAVAATVGTASAVFSGIVLAESGVTLAVGLLVAGAVAPLLAARAATPTRAQADSTTEVVTLAQTMIESAAELEVSGGRQELRDQLNDAEQRRVRSLDRTSRSVAGAAAMQALAAGLSVVGAFWFGVAAVQAGRLDAVWLVVVTLLPLAAFETTLALPAAAVELVRGARSATRIAQLLDSSATGEQPGVGLPARTDPSRLVAHIDTGWDATVLRSFDLELDLRLGRSYALVGPSGIGKTSLLLTLAGLIPARAGSVRLDGTDVRLIDQQELARLVNYTAEDAHIFATTIGENLRLAAGPVPDEELLDALRRVGLRSWLEGLPDGLDTVLGSGGVDISGGQRRRLLVARALLTGARVLLLDEPTEHVDVPGSKALLRDLAAMSGRHPGLGRPVTVVVATHARECLEHFDFVLELGGDLSSGSTWKAPLPIPDSPHRPSYPTRRSG
ncbi:MAG: thiol reductant ABC exporter subunit CydC [Micrococcales bacterium]|nr:MAG: thiol reductant ABC exporter subunit CydC [Micrococcales bacterium]